MYDRDSFLKMLGEWAVINNINNLAFSALLILLKNINLYITRTVLKTDNFVNGNQFQCVQPGLYYHIGIENGLKSLREVININEDTLKIIIGIDGLPLTKSSNSTFWPILGYLHHTTVIPYVFFNWSLLGT